jgi:trigger factor
MNLEVEETGPVERRLRIEVPTAEVDAAFDAVFRNFGRSARIPGFRKGKIPRSVLERHFGETARDDVLQHLVQQSLPQAINEGQLAVVGEPRLEPTEHPKQGASFSYEVLVEIRPSIELKQVRGLVIRRPVLPEPEQDPVEAHLEQMRLAQGQLIQEAPGAVAAGAHVAVIDFDATIDGEAFEGGSGRESTVEIGANRSIPGFEDQLVGMSPGQERDFELELPESYPEDLAGKTATFHVKLLELKRRELPELDDEFAKDVSECESLEALKTDLRRRVEAGREAEEKRLLREAVIEALIEANTFPVPTGLVERQLQGQLQRAASQFQGRLPDEKVREVLERWQEEWRPRAERDVRLALLVPEIAKAEQLEVTPDEVDEHLRHMAQEQGESVSKLKRAYREKGLLGVLESGLLEERVLEFLISQATLCEV